MVTPGVVLQIDDLHVHFATHEGTALAVNGASLTLHRGRILALVGESGCGKSVTSYAILRLVQPPGRIVRGRIRYYTPGGESLDITALGDRDEALFRLRGGQIGMIFQEPMTALSPVHTIGDQITEVVRLHRGANDAAARARAADLLGRVGIPDALRRLDQYPFELSGGMRQRVVIAMALAAGPDVLIADEPTTALDVTIQAQIIQLLRSLQADLGLSALLITHDLGVVAQLADDVSVMYLGRVIEQAPVRDLIRTPRHPYTAGLLASLPARARAGERLPAIEGRVPSPLEIPCGCSFHPRCRHCLAGHCDAGAPPPLQEVEGARQVACWRATEQDWTP
jgi:oligopeptide/dipeptide ABC transporter ATP-binding protein